MGLLQLLHLKFARIPNALVFGENLYRRSLQGRTIVSLLSVALSQVFGDVKVRYELWRLVKVRIARLCFVHGLPRVGNRTARPMVVNDGSFRGRDWTYLN